MIKRNRPDLPERAIELVRGPGRRSRVCQAAKWKRGIVLAHRDSYGGEINSAPLYAQ